MANYKPPQNRPAVESLRKDFGDQSVSDNFLAGARKLIAGCGMEEEPFVLNCIAHLYEREGVSELTEFMSFVKLSLGIVDESKTQSKAYEFVKGIPALSEGRIGYTFNRKGGLFFFLRDHGAQ